MKRALISIGILAALLVGFAFPLAANADTQVLKEACNGAPKDSAVCSGADNKSNPLTGPNGVIHNVTILVARMAGVVAIIVIIYGGLQMVIGGDDPGKIKTARQTIIYALVGIAIIVFGQTIILFIMDRF